MPTSGSRSEKLRILVVENDKDTLRLLKRYLESSGYAVEEASTVEGGLSLLAVQQFDVIISDIGLPDGDGWTLLLNAPPNSFSLAIAMTGFGKGDDRAKSRAAGFHHHLLKPFDPDVLLDILERFSA